MPIYVQGSGTNTKEFFFQNNIIAINLLQQYLLKLTLTCELSEEMYLYFCKKDIRCGIWAVWLSVLTINEVINIKYLFFNNILSWHENDVA
jgi:hypothetical protein